MTLEVHEPQQVERLSYNQQETAEALGISISTANRWMSKGILKSVRIGGVVLVSRGEIDRLLREGANHGISK